MAKKIAYEITRLSDWQGEGETLVFHIQGDIEGIDSAFPVDSFKPGNTFESEQDFTEWCKRKGEQFGFKVKDNTQKKESKVANVSINMHQRDDHTIQMYVMDVREGDRPHYPVTVEHPDKHPNKLKSNGEPYAREHESLFNILKAELVRLGKWE